MQEQKLNGLKNPNEYELIEPNLLPISKNSIVIRYVVRSDEDTKPQLGVSVQVNVAEKEKKLNEKLKFIKYDIYRGTIAKAGPAMKIASTLSFSKENAKNGAVGSTLTVFDNIPLTAFFEEKFSGFSDKYTFLTPPKVSAVLNTSRLFPRPQVAQATPSQTRPQAAVATALLGWG